MIQKALRGNGGQKLIDHKLSNYKWLHVDRWSELEWRPNQADYLENARSQRSSANVQPGHHRTEPFHGTLARDFSSCTCIETILATLFLRCSKSLIVLQHATIRLFLQARLRLGPHPGRIPRAELLKVRTVSGSFGRCDS